MCCLDVSNRVQCWIHNNIHSEKHRFSQNHIHHEERDSMLQTAPHACVYRILRVYHSAPSRGERHSNLTEPNASSAFAPPTPSLPPTPTSAAVADPWKADDRSVDVVIEQCDGNGSAVLMAPRCGGLAPVA